MNEIEHKIAVQGGMIIMGAISFSLHFLISNSDHYIAIVFVITAIEVLSFIKLIAIDLERIESKKQEDADKIWRMLIEKEKLKNDDSFYKSTLENLSKDERRNMYFNEPLEGGG